MLTPSFSLSQCDEYVVIVIRVPFAKVSDAEIDIDGCEFRFHSKPYFLRLNFPAELISSEESAIIDPTGEDPVQASYDVDAGSFTIRARKKNRGEYFADLDFLTKLLAPPGVTEAKPVLVEEIGEPSKQNGATGLAESLEEVELSDEDEFDWQLEQEPYIEQKLSIEGPRYGFANKRSGVFKRLQAELTEAIDLRNIDETNEQDRTRQRLEAELSHFSQEHYLADLYEPEAVEYVLQYKPVLTVDSNSDKGSPNYLSSTDRDDMLSLPRRKHILESVEKHCMCLALVDILYAYAYDRRTTEGEQTVESGWTICKLSSTLSWLESWNGRTLKDVIISCYRRALCYPLYRHWRLCDAVLADVINILTAGRAAVLACLLSIRRTLSHTDQQYILNDLYITEYCVWIQSASDKRISTLAKRLQEVKLTKDDVGFDLEALEKAAEFEATEESTVEQLSKNLRELSTLETENLTKHCQDIVDSDDENSEEEQEEEEENSDDDETSDTEDSDSDSDTCSEPRTSPNGNVEDVSTTPAAILGGHEQRDNDNIDDSATSNNSNLNVTEIINENISGKDLHSKFSEKGSSSGTRAIIESDFLLEQCSCSNSTSSFERSHLESTGLIVPIISSDSSTISRNNSKPLIEVLHSSEEIDALK